MSRVWPQGEVAYLALPHGLVPQTRPLEATTVTLRKTLIGALMALLLLTGFSSQALAQDDTTTTTDTTTTDSTMTDTDTAATESSTDATTNGQGESTVAESFEETETPNPQPSEPLPAPADTAPAAGVAADSAVAAPTAAEQVAGETQLAYTGPDSRIIALGLLLLGAGLVFAVVSRQQELRLAEVDSWLE